MSEGPTFHNPEVIGPPLSEYSLVARAGDFLYLAGTAAVDMENNMVGPDIESQTVATYENIRLVLESQGATLRDIVKTTTYLSDPDDVKRFWAARAKYFKKHYPEGVGYPPNSLLIVKMLFPDQRLEVDSVAYRPQGA